MSARTVFLWAMFCPLLVMPSPSFGRQASAVRDKDLENDVLKAEEDLAQAEIHADVSAIDRLSADNYTHTHGDGFVESKTDYISDVRTGKRAYNGIRFSDRTVHFFSSTTAIITGHVKITTKNSLPNNNSDDTFLEVWVRDNGTWRCGAWATIHPPPKKPDASSR